MEAKFDQNVKEAEQEGVQNKNSFFYKSSTVCKKKQCYFATKLRFGVKKQYKAKTRCDNDTPVRIRI